MSTRDKLLSHRLQTIFDLIDQGSTVADIGTDHAYLPIALALEGKCPLIYAIDNKQGPLSQARKMVDFYGVSDRVRCHLVQDEHPYHHVDVWVIAGMGYENAKAIMTQYKSTIRKLKKVIVQINHQVDKMRVYCMDNGLRILDETIVEDDFFYMILTIAYDGDSVVYDEQQLFLGPVLMKKKGDVFLKYCHIKKEQLLLILHEIPSRHPKKQIILKQIKMLDVMLDQ